MYHYTVFKSAGVALSNPEGVEPKEFQRLDAIREASRTAIALEAGIITKIPTDGRLTGLALTRTNQLITRYDISDRTELMEAA